MPYSTRQYPAGLQPVLHNGAAWRNSTTQHLSEHRALPIVLEIRATSYLPQLVLRLLYRLPIHAMLIRIDAEVDHS